MTKSDAFVKIMDEAARRVLSGTERPYDVAYDTCGELAFLEDDSSSVASWTAYVHWIGLTDIVEMLDGPAEQLCDELAGEFSRMWLALANRDDETAQRAFMAEFDLMETKRIAEYRATNGLPPLDEHPARR